MNVVWHDPLPLAGVKSRNRAIFELQEAIVSADEKDCLATKVSLALSSHVVAIGSAGKAVADIVLGAQEIKGCSTQNRHDELVVLHLDSDIIDEDSLVAALESRPHVVVLTEPLCAEEPWARLFADVVRSDSLRSFKGALIICVGNEESIPSDLCRSRWIASNGRLKIEKVIAGLVVIDDICAKAKTDESLGVVLPEITDLAHQSFAFELENFGGVREIEAIAEMEDWTVASLSIRDSSDQHELVGYMAYKFEPAMQSLYLARIAVKPACRGCGYAAYMVRWLMTKSRQLGCGAVSAWAKPAMQPITLKLGFKYYFDAEADMPAEDRVDCCWMVFRDRPMDLGLGFDEDTEEVPLDVPPMPKKLSKNERRKEFKKKR